MQAAGRLGAAACVLRQPSAPWGQTRQRAALPSPRHRIELDHQPSQWRLSPALAGALGLKGQHSVPFVMQMLWGYIKAKQLYEVHGCCVCNWGGAVVLFPPMLLLLLLPGSFGEGPCWGCPCVARSAAPLRLLPLCGYAPAQVLLLPSVLPLTPAHPLLPPTAAAQRQGLCVHPLRWPAA